jgi:hypothetical protein
LCFIIICYLLIVPSKGHPNGSGVPRTPYNDSITAQEIEKVRIESSSYRVIKDIRTKDSEVPVYGERIGFAYVSDDGEIGEIAFEITGTAKGEGDVIVPLSDVKSFTVLEVKNTWFSKDKALLKVTIFPSISASQLLQAQPTYSQLIESYMSELRIWVFLENTDKGELCVVGKKWGDNYKVLFSVRDLALNVPVSFDWVVMKNTPIWWAIKSVIGDDKYPHRIRYLH